MFVLWYNTIKFLNKSIFLKTLFCKKLTLKGNLQKFEIEKDVLQLTSNEMFAIILQMELGIDNGITRVKFWRRI